MTRVTGWDQGRPFGVGSFAEPVRLANGPGLYEPASSADSRRIALHTAGGEFLVQTNLPRALLVRVAGSLPVETLAFPGSWRIPEVPLEPIQSDIVFGVKSIPMTWGNKHEGFSMSAEGVAVA